MLYFSKIQHKYLQSYENFNDLKRRALSYSCTS